MQEINTIQLDEPTNDILDYKFLRQRGIELIQELAGNMWTDYNYHDPGITILEILSYALTELGYRSRTSVKDTLASQNKTYKDTLFAPSEILPSLPVTIKDFHKIIFDIDGVKDVIFYQNTEYPEFSGIYNINIELFPEFDNPESQKRIKKTVYTKINENRNLCEDFSEVKFIEHEMVTFEIDVEISEELNIADIYIKIYEELTEYLAPSIKFQSLQDRIDEGCEVDEIFNGPFLKSGFVNDSEFHRLVVRNIISASDIIHFIMDIESVETIKKLLIIDNKGKTHKWLQTVEEGKAFKLDVENTKIRFFKLGKIVKLQKDISQDIYKIDKKEESRLKYKRLTFDKEIGLYRNLKKYYSIQNDFPEIYGLGQLGLLPSETPARKGQAKQLKAYLLIFEQILANFYAQLDNLNELFSIENITNTYFGQPLIDIPGVEALYQPFTKDCIKNNIPVESKKILKKEWNKNLEKNELRINRIVRDIIEDESTFFDRRNRVLDHLLARMAFDYTRYRFDFEHVLDHEKKLIKYKTNILKNYISLSQERAKAFNNIEEQLDNKKNISGLEDRVNILLKLRSDSKSFPFDFYKKKLSIEKKADAKPKKKKDEIVFKNMNKNDVLTNLFFYATDSTNYTQETDNEEKISVNILNDYKEQFAFLPEKFANPKKAQRGILKIAKKLEKISRKSEAFFLFERILYRPHPKMKYFTFTILYEDNTPAFINKDYLTFAERKYNVAKIIQLGQKRENFSIVKVSKQFKIVIKDENNIELLLSHRFFNTKSLAEKEIKYHINFFTQIEDKKIDILDYINYYTKHYDLYNLTVNPYSFILTILIPNWPEKFQKEAFKMHLVNTIKDEIPSHIYPDIKWVGIDKLIIMNELAKEYQSILHSEEQDFIRLTEISDELFGYFLDRK